MSAVRSDARTEGADDRRPAPTWALIVLPIVVVVGLYLWIPRARIDGEIAAFRTDTAAARASAPTPSTESLENARLLDLRETAEDLRAKSKAGTKTARVATGPAAHARRAASVTSALSRNGLALIEDLAALAEGEEAARRLQGLHASEIRATGAPARALTFDGSFFEGLAALREITGADIEALPLVVELKRSGDGRTLRWRLVWI